jgi:heme exporter protein C
MMKKGLIQYILIALSLIFIITTIYLAIFYAPLVPTDVSIVARSPSSYTEYELRVKGIVEDWDGDSSFNLTDAMTPEFKLTVQHTGSLPQGFGSGQGVILTGELTDTENLVFASSEVELDDEPYESAGWVAPYAQKIFYLHTPAAWASYVAFGVVFITSIMFLRTSNVKWDVIARSSAEIGVVLCTLAIVTGPIWAKPEWGVYWRWEDAKLLTTFILWLIFLAYVVLRMGVEGEKTARIAAVFGIAGFVAVPLSFISSRIWQSLHPNPVGSPGGLSPEAGMTLMVGVIAFTLLYVTIMMQRIDIQKSMEKVEDLKEKTEVNE